jgi:phenylacetate-coenzyme A ligase PaaK-like adenylate-forming protein
LILARLSRDLPSFLRRTVDLAEARRRLAEHLETREQRFLALADRAIFGNARSPYLPLLRHVGCERGDLQRMVQRDGLDGALTALARAGVYVASEEIKGVRDAIRGSARFHFDEAQFDNPTIPVHFIAQTSGSGGSPTVVRRSLEMFGDFACWLRLSQAAHGLEHPRHTFWMTGPLWWGAIYGKLDQPVDAWFHQLDTLPWQLRIGARYVQLLGRLGGQRWPGPTLCDLRDPTPLAHWLAQQARLRGPAVLTTAASGAARVAAAALAARLDLAGVTFVVKSEPLTAARRQAIEAVGARVIVLYGSMECPMIGSGCASPTTADDMHLAADANALITRPRTDQPGGPTVDALLVTTLAPHTAKIYLNAETGDYAQVEVRECDCLLGTLGLRTHLSHVRSFDKLTGEGVTFLRANLEAILEDVLPARFGGTPMDYQLVEDEDADGSARLRLYIAPAVGPIDEAAARATLLAELSKGSLLNHHMAALWRRAETITVRRAPPLQTRAGKVLPFQAAGRGA